MNPLIITNSDKKKLIELSENIMNGKEKNGIEKISFILSKISIYLPLTDDDYQKLLAIKKDKSQKERSIKL